MSNHNITPTFSGAGEKKPWYKRPLTYVIAVPIILVIAIVNGIVGDRGTPPGADGDLGKAAHTESIKVTEEPEPVAEPVDDEPLPAQSMEERALEVLRELHPEMHFIEDEVITDAARAACQLFDSGGDFETYMLVAVENGVTPEQAGAIAGVGVNVYCPQHANIAG